MNEQQPDEHIEQQPDAQQTDAQAEGQIPKAPQQPEKQHIFWRRSRSTSWKGYIPTRYGLFVLLCLFSLCLGLALYGGITVATSTPQISGVSVAGHSSSAAITVDFASRQNHAHPIGNVLLGMNGFSKIRSDAQLLSYVNTTHIKIVRISVDMTGTFPTPASVNPSQQNWAELDRSMAVIQAQHLQPVLTVEFSPPWLQPQKSPCPSGVDPAHVIPTSVSKWGMLAAQVVAHMDASFPGVHPYYEMWNEPDGVTFLCVPTSDPNAEQTRLNQYTAIYAAAAPLMKQQAQRDHATIYVGGPALAVARLHSSMWLTALINDSRVAPYLDFITYHNYFRQGDTWSHMLTRLQDPAAGVAPLFEEISSIVHKGKQPNAQSTPIIIDEYNVTTQTTDCCRNDKTYAPLWNALYVADLLNSVNDIHSPYGAASAFVSGLGYFSATPQSPSSSHFCLFGTWNSAMDCAQNGNIQPYPQYYAYQLLGDSHYLDMTNGAYITSAATGQPADLVVSGFYTRTKDNVFIVNTGATTYTQVTIAVKNPGLSHATASVYTLNASHSQIGTSSTTLSATSGGYTVTISVPAYSTVAVSIV